MEAAVAWYEKQLTVNVPMALAVLDEETRGKASTNPVLYFYVGVGGPGLNFFRRASHIRRLLRSKANKLPS